METTQQLKEEHYMGFLTKEQVLREFRNAKDTDLFCAFCYETIAYTKEGILYCPNEMCLNDDNSEGD